MRIMRLRFLLVIFACGITIGVAAATFVHLPKITLVQTDTGVRKVRTYGATVGDALRDAGISVGARDRVFPALSAEIESGMTITVQRAFTVTLLVDGRRQVRTTTTATVEEFLAEAGISVGSADQTYPVLDGGLWPGARVRVVRVVTRVMPVEEPIPFAVSSRPDPTLPQGAYRVLRHGRTGVRLRRVAITTADGVPISQQQLSSEVARPAVDHVQVVGALRIAASRGDLEGKEVMHMEATGYAPWHGIGVDGTTAIGLRAGYGVVAVDPRVIPLRSVLYIEGYGKAIAGDTGGAIKGPRVDLGFNTAGEAYKWGRRPVRVYILSKPTARR
jgi:uncharacterized protein YabE (DUF348 family)